MVIDLATLSVQEVVFWCSIGISTGLGFIAGLWS